MKYVLHRVGSWLHAVFEEGKQTGQKNTITVLDGVRACAILLVITFHIDYTTGHDLWNWHVNPLASSIALAGASGVNLFFVLSGFLLFLPYAKALLFAGRWPLARSFYVRRALRIMPGYYLSLFLLIFFTAPQYLQPANLGKLALFLTFLMDSSRSTFRLLNGPFWTLAVEWQFYMILPLLMLGISLLVRRVPIAQRLRAVTLCLCGVIAGGLCVRLFGLYFSEHAATILFVPRSALNIFLFFSFGIVGKYLEEFAVGMLCSLIYVYTQSLPTEHRFIQNLRRASLWLWGTGILILTFCAMWNFQSFRDTPAWPFLDPIMPYFNWLNEMFLAIAFGMCVLAILFGPRELQRPFNWKALRWLGLISYSLYIWHLPLLTLGHHVLPGYDHLNQYIQYVFCWTWMAVVAVPFCILFYAFVERPGIKLGDRWRTSMALRRNASIQQQKASDFDERQTVTPPISVESQAVHP